MTRPVPSPTLLQTALESQITQSEYRPTDLVSWAWDRYGEHLANTAGLGAEARPSEVDLGPGERAEVTVDLHPNTAGKVIAAIAAIERGAEELLAVSEIVALSVNEDGEIHREA